ncbi:MAG: protein translocase subunit SecF, partial [Pseudomonadota bacterium]
MTQAQTNIDFMGKRKIAFVFSAVLMLVSIVSLGVQGLRLGIDFTGGTLIELGYPKAIDVKELRGLLAENGFNDATVQHFGSTKDILVRLAPKAGVSSAALSDKLLAIINQGEGTKAELRRAEFVG